MKAQRLGGILGAALLLFQIVQAIRSYQGMQVLFQYPWLILLALGLLCLSTLQQMVAWSLLMRSLGVIIPWRALQRGYILSFLPRYIPGTVWGYLSRGEWLYQDYKVPYAISNVGSLLEISIAIFSNIVVMVLSIASRLTGFDRFLIIVMLVITVFLVWWLLKKVLFSKRFVTNVSGDYSCFSFQVWLFCLLLITVNMFIYGASLYLTVLSLNISNISFSNISLAFGTNWLPLTFTFSVAWLIGFLVFIFPSGLGLREVTLSGLLVANFGMTYENASTVSVLFRLWVTLAELLWILLIGWHWIGKKFSRSI